MSNQKKLTHAENKTMNNTKDAVEVLASDQRLVGRVPLFICKHCGHEWDDGSRYYCGCGGPYRIPNHDLSDSPNASE